MKRLMPLFAVALFCMAAPLAFAAPPTDAQIDKLLEVMRARQTVDAMLPQIESSQKQMMAQMTAGQNVTPEQRASIERIVDKTNARIRPALAWDKLEPMYRDIYRQTFSGEDVDAMVEFYGSAAGQRVLDKMPQLMQQTMAAMQKLVVPMLQDMQRDIREETQAGGEDASSK